MFYVSYYLDYSYGLLLFQYHYFVTNTIIYYKFTRNPQGVVVTCSTLFCPIVLYIRIATIIKDNAKVNDNFLFRYHSAITTKSEGLS